MSRSLVPPATPDEQTRTRAKQRTVLPATGRALDWGWGVSAPPTPDASEAQEVHWAAPPAPDTGPAVVPPPPSDAGQQRRRRARPRVSPRLWAGLIGVVGLLAGLGIGGVVGYTAGAASSLIDALGDPHAEVGPDAWVGGGPVDAVHIAVGDLAVTRLEVHADFADDFIADVTVTNEGDDWGGGPIELRFFDGETPLGSVAGEVPALDSGASVQLQLWGFDAYDPRVERVEIHIG